LAGQKFAGVATFRGVGGEDEKNMRAYKIAIFCGITPLLVGTTIFVLWLTTRWSKLEGFGIFTIFGGIVLFAIGVISLVIHTVGQNKIHEGRSKLIIENTKAAGLLLLNFPVALLIIYLVSYFQSFYILTIRNNTSYSVNNFVLSSTGNNISIGSIPSNQAVTTKFRVGEGSITFKTSINGKALEGTIDGYVSGSGDKKIVTFLQDQSFTVQKY